MLAFRTIISASGSLSRTAQLFDLRDNLFLVYIGESGCKPVCRCSEFGHVSRFDGFAWGWDVHSKCLAAPGHGDRRIGLQKPGNLFAELPNPHFDSRHKQLLVYASVYTD